MNDAQAGKPEVRIAGMLPALERLGVAGMAVLLMNVRLESLRYMEGNQWVFVFEKRLLKPKEYELFVTRCLKTLEKLRRNPPKPMRPPAPAAKKVRPKKKVVPRRQRSG